MMASKSWAAAYTAITSSSWGFSTVSILLMTSTAGSRSSLMRSMRACSGAPILAMGSTSRHTPSTSATLWRTTFTM